MGCVAEHCCQLAPGCIKIADVQSTLPRTPLSEDKEDLILGAQRTGVLAQTCNVENMKHGRWRHREWKVLGPACLATEHTVVCCKLWSRTLASRNKAMRAQLTGRFARKDLTTPGEKLALEDVWPQSVDAAKHNDTLQPRTWHANTMEHCTAQQDVGLNNRQQGGADYACEDTF